MKRRIYSLFDRKVREYGPLVVEKNDVAVIRSLRDGVTGSNSVQEKHSKDFDLYCLGELDIDTGIIDGAVEFVSGLEDVLKGEVTMDLFSNGEVVDADR